MSLLDELGLGDLLGGNGGPEPTYASLGADAPVAASPVLAPERPAGPPTDFGGPLLAGFGGNGDTWAKVQPLIQAISLSLLTHTDRRNPLGNLGQFLPAAMQQAQEQQRMKALGSIAGGLNETPDFTKSGSGSFGATSSGMTAPSTAPKPVSSGAGNKTMPNEAGGPSGNASFASLPMSESSLDKVIRTVYGEAAGEGPTGQAAVAAVIANRAKQAGMDPADVVLAKNQFEPWGNPAARRRMLDLNPESDKYQAIRAAVLPVLTGEAPDPTNGATHFYAPKAQAALGRPVPRWDDGSGVDLGNHRFFALGYGGGGKDGIQRREAPVPPERPSPSWQIAQASDDQFASQLARARGTAGPANIGVPVSPLLAGDPNLPAPALPGLLDPELTAAPRPPPAAPRPMSQMDVLAQLTGGGQRQTPAASSPAPMPVAAALAPARPGPSPADVPMPTSPSSRVAGLGLSPTVASTGGVSPVLAPTQPPAPIPASPILPEPVRPSASLPPAVNPVLAGTGLPPTAPAAPAPPLPPSRPPGFNGSDPRQAPGMLTPGDVLQGGGNTLPMPRGMDIPAVGSFSAPNVPNPVRMARTAGGATIDTPVPPPRPTDLSGVPSPPARTAVERAEPATGAPAAVVASQPSTGRARAVAASEAPTVGGRPVAPQRLAEVPDYSNAPDAGMRAFLTDPGNRIPNGVPTAYASLPGQPAGPRAQNASVAPIAGSTAAARVAQNINAADDQRPAYERPVGNEPGAYRELPTNKVADASGRTVPSGDAAPSPAAALTAPSAASQAGRLPETPQQLPGAPPPPNPNFTGQTARVAAENYARKMRTIQLQASLLGGDQGKAVAEIAKQNIERYADPYLKPSDHMKMAQELVDADPRIRPLLVRQLANTAPTSTQEYEYYKADQIRAGKTAQSYSDWDLARRREESNKGEDAFSADLGKARAKRADATESAITDAPNQIAKLNLAQGLLARASTGALAPIHSKVVGFGQALGMTPEQIQGLGLNPNAAVTKEAAEKVVNELTVGMIGKGGFPANNFSDADRNFLTKIFPSLTNRPEANAIAIDVLKGVQQRRLEAANAWGTYQDAEEAAGRTPSYAKWERQFQKDAEKTNLFEDAQKRIDALPKSGPGVPGAPSASGAPRQTAAEPAAPAGRTVDALADVPENATYRTEAGNVYKKVNGKAVFIRKEKP